MIHSDPSSFVSHSNLSHQDPYLQSNHFNLPKSNLSVKVETVDPPDLCSSLPAVADLSYNRHSTFFQTGTESASCLNSFTFMSDQHWQSNPANSSISDHPSNRPVGVSFDLPSNPSQPLSFEGDYDDGDELGDLPLTSTSGLGSSGKSADKQVRRRSSKACDQCRKLKCKCERTGDNLQCRSCLMFNAQCTFLGPSRKRGPPKGYIDAIEVRLHQTEALIGILLAMAAGPHGSDIKHGDSRAQSLIEDLSQDPLAREIINRVDNSTYGFKGRKKSDPSSSTPTTKGPPRDQQNGSGKSELYSTHPSHEWQDQVISKMLERQDSHSGSAKQSFSDVKPVLTVQATSLDVPNSEVNEPSPRRLRRKIDSRADIREVASPSCSPKSPMPSSYPSVPYSLSVESSRVHSPEYENEDGGEREEQLEEAVGQLSLNEDEQVRFHGKASGLHLLGVKERVDGRNEGGIWKFPKARVWPPLPGSNESSKNEEDFPISMPNQAMQEYLMGLYWTYVHPALPIVHKQSFIEQFQRGLPTADSPFSGSQASTSSQSNRSLSHVPTVLLLAMFSLAARYCPPPSSSQPNGVMWDAGDIYLESAKTILGSTYSTPRVGTCQALLLLGYREIGIGAMAQAWINVGMAVRMAQDLGMHKSADKWQRVGGSMFSPSELQERRRIWYGCVVMDKYVSAYIGRPVCIFEHDFDTELPNEDEMEELEVVELPISPDPCEQTVFRRQEGLTRHCISCFNASARLSVILSRVIQDIYAIRPDGCRTGQLVQLEELLEKWFLELPEWLRFDPMVKSTTPPPHVMTLHMQYWCSVLLLHRPFIRHLSTASVNSFKETDVQAASRKSYDMCVQAANRITAIVGCYRNSYSIKASSVFLCYYLFTASITHVSTLTLFSDDPQARLGLNRCMDALNGMEILWPSAGRAWELLNGSKVNLSKVSQTHSNFGGDRQKRSAEETLDNEDTAERRESLEQFIAGTNAPPSFPNIASHSGTFQPGNMPYLSPYKSWTSTVGNSNTMNSLTTSVLPQQYSTGFVDTRSISTRTMRGQSDDRYSQYWNDYSVLGQLDPTYGVPMLLDSSGPRHSDVVAENQLPTMYLSQPYSLFSSPPANQRP